jgi:hypothetical protein
MDTFFQIGAAVAMGWIVAEMFCAVEVDKAQRREKRRVERWVSERCNRKQGI